MTDIKRVTITSVPANKVEKKDAKRKRTIRIKLTLPESNEKSCPEFNYGDLLSHHLSRRLGKDRLGDVINGPQRDQGDPYASDEDEALRALARKFEKKYGGAAAAAGTRRRKRKRENDFQQLGEGYDETDPFIDNSDAVDDVLATNMETKLGGFYINSGMLKFEEVQVSEDEASNDSDVLRTAKKKRQNQISSSEEEDHSEAKETKIRENGVLKAKKRKLDEGEMLRRRKQMIDKFNAKKQKQRGATSENETDSKVAEGQPERHDDSKASSIGTSIAASIEAVVSKAREGVGLDESCPQPPATVEEEPMAAEEDDDEDGEDEREEEEKEESSSSDSSSLSSAESSSSDSESEDEKEDRESGKEEGERRADEKDEEEVEGAAVATAVPTTDVEREKEEESNEGGPQATEVESDHMNNVSDSDKDNNALPSDLSPNLIAALDRIKEIGKNSKASSQKFFTEPVNKLLLSIEIKLLNFGVRKKNMVYNHLSQHLPCGTQTLVKRGKNLLAERLEERLKPPIKKLKEALDQVMPPLVEAHAVECQKIAEKKGEDQPRKEDETAETEHDKRAKLPKKKFEFTKELKDLLLDIVKTRSQSWNLIKKRSETAEGYIKSFLDTQLKPLWPKGWVTTKFLYKESQPAHSLITAKNSKKTVGTKKMNVLGGGMVSNNNVVAPAGPSVQTSVTTLPSLIIAAKDEKLRTSSVDGEGVSPTTALKPLQETEPRSSSVTKQHEEKVMNALKESSKEKNKDGTINKQTSLKEIADKPTTKSGIHNITKVNISKSSNTSPSKETGKASAESQLFPSISPSSEASPKSFHGFESPKSQEMQRGNETANAKQSLAFDSLKKQSRVSMENADSLPLVREGKPPKPSLTATARPKMPVSSSVSISKAEGAAKSGRGDGLDLQHQKTDAISYKTKEDQRKTAPTCITIKSVEAINETVGVDGPQPPPPSKSEKPKAKEGSVSAVDLSSHRDKRLSPPTEASKPAGSDVRLIDLASEDDGDCVQRVNSRTSNATRKDLLGPIASAAVSIQNVSSCDSNKSHNSSSASRTDSFSKNKLEEEMDQVMNELLQISKKNLKGGEEFPIKHGTGSAVLARDTCKSPTSRSADSEISRGNPAPHQKKSFSQSTSQVLPRKPAIVSSPNDMSKMSTSVQSTNLSTTSTDLTNPKASPSSQNYKKLNMSKPSSDFNSMQMQKGSHAHAHVGITSYGTHPGVQSASLKVPQSGGQSSAKRSPGSGRSSHNNVSHIYDSDSPSSRTSSLHDSHSRAPSSGTSGNPGVTFHAGGSRSSSSSGPSYSQAPIAPPLSSPTQGPAVSVNNRSPAPSHNNVHRTSPSIHTGGQRPAPSTNTGSQRTAPSTNARSLPMNHSVSTSQSGSHQRVPSAHIPEQQHHGPSMSKSGVHGSISTREMGASQLRGYAPNNVGNRSSQGIAGGQAQGLTHTGPHSSSRNKMPQTPSLRSPNPVHSTTVPSRTTKSSHNIEGLLYNHSSSKNSSPTVDLTSPKKPYSHSQHSSHTSQSNPHPSGGPKSQPKFPPQSSSSSWVSQEPSLAVRSSSNSSSKVPSGSIKSSSNSKQKTKEASYSAGNAADPLANLRQMECLSVSNVPKKPHSGSTHSNSSNSATTRQQGSSSSSNRTNSSVQPKIKQRSDSFSMPPHPMVGNLTTEQQQELWQQVSLKVDKK